MLKGVHLSCLMMALSPHPFPVWGLCRWRPRCAPSWWMFLSVPLAHLPCLLPGQWGCRSWFSVEGKTSITVIDRLQCGVGISGIALSWFSSYLSNRSFAVNLGHFSSSSASLSCGVLQGTILGPVLFSIYMIPLGQIIQKHNISFHCYADDTQLYLPLKPNDRRNLNSLLDCLEDIKCWMAQNVLQLNENKS